MHNMILSDTSLSASRILGLLIHELQAVKLQISGSMYGSPCLALQGFDFVGKLLHVSFVGRTSFEEEPACVFRTCGKGARSHRPRLVQLVLCSRKPEIETAHRRMLEHITVVRNVYVFWSIPPFYHGLAAVHHRALELSYRFRGLL